MEVNGIRSAQDLVGATSQTDPTKDLGKNQFLELMIAQFNNQNPLDPSKNEDFIAQLAQFSSLEGIENLNASVESMANAMRSSVTLDAAALVGRSVLVPTDQTMLTDRGLGGLIRDTGSTSDIQIEISTLAGEVVRRMSMASTGADEQRFVWDGANEGGTQLLPGAYRVRAYGTIAGQQTELAVELPGQVVSVSLGEDGVTANLAAGTSVPISQVREIQ